jgi:hypothetical protein
MIRQKPRWSAATRKSPLQSPSYHRIFMVTAIFLIFFGANVNAQPINRSQLSCDIYDRLNQRCNCKDKDNYLVSYGRRYCYRFLTTTDWSPRGSEWRNQTLACLQTALIEHLAKTSTHVCDCKHLKDYAFQTHVRCYTQQAASVCRLPVSDLVTIYRIIDSVDLLDPYGLRQILGVIRICIGESTSR